MRHIHGETDRADRAPARLPARTVLGSSSPHFKRGILELEWGIRYTYFARLPFALYTSVAKGFSAENCYEVQQGKELYILSEKFN